MTNVEVKFSLEYDGTGRPCAIRSNIETTVKQCEESTEFSQIWVGPHKEPVLDRTDKSATRRKIFYRSVEIKLGPEG